MAWPPTIPPANITNATPQIDRHASDHNAITDALREIVANSTAYQYKRSEFTIPFNVQTDAKTVSWDVEWGPDTDPKPFPVISALFASDGSLLVGWIGAIRSDGGKWKGPVYASYRDGAPITAGFQGTARMVVF
jgi:hypothetical protein